MLYSYVWTCDGIRVPQHRKSWIASVDRAFPGFHCHRMTSIQSEVHSTRGEMQTSFSGAHKYQTERCPAFELFIVPISYQSWMFVFAGGCTRHHSINLIKNAAFSQVRQMEAVVAGALRREQAADVATKRLAAEIEQLNRLVR